MSVNPTVYEQYQLELVNWARANPSAQADQLGIDLNEDLSPGTISPDPKPPLAFNALLIDAARDHSQWMLDNDTFSHTGINDSDPGDRMIDAGYDLLTGGENISMRGTTGPMDIEAFTVSAHEGLFISSGHRENLMQASFKEIGLGLVTGEFTRQHDGVIFDTLMTTQKFGTSSSGPFLTGVIFDDSDGDGFYSIGEGIGGATILAEGTHGTFETTTWGAGGYNLELPAGSYEVTFSYQGRDLTTDVTIGQDNVKLDALLEELTGEEHLVLNSPRDDFAVTLHADGTVTVEKLGGDSDTYSLLERIEFDDGVLAFDIDSANLGFSYRIYAAAYGRTPDEDGLRFWVDVMDQLETSQPSLDRKDFLAREFLEAEEFIILYGQNPSDEDYIEAMFQNVLDRAPDQGGYEFWLDSMEAGLDRADILVYFAESPENVAQTAPDLSDGVWLV